MNKRIVSFNVMLSPQEKTNLQILANSTGKTKAQVIREAVGNMFLMTAKRTATCANGQTCFVPHMHPTPPVPSPPESVSPSR